MAAPKAKKGVMVSVVAKVPVTYNDEQFMAGEPLDVEEIDLKQLLDVSAVELVKTEPAQAASDITNTSTNNSDANAASDLGTGVASEVATQDGTVS